MKFATAILGSVALFVATAAYAQDITGDPVAGEKVFAKCKACHTVEESKNRVGPHLDGVIGRPTASIADFKYSKAMHEAGEHGMVWDVPTLTTYLADPKALVPGTKMAFAGLKSPDDIANVIAYLNQHPAM